MWKTAGVCPDCNTSVSDLHGPQWCETCWRVVAMSKRDGDGSLQWTGRFMRLPARMQGVPGILEALRYVGLLSSNYDAA